MKKYILLFILLSIVSGSASAQQNQVRKKDPAGRWKFEAPYAPEGYTSGQMNFGIAENKCTADMKFTGIDYRFIGEKVRFVNDSVFFTVFLEGQVIDVSLKLEDTAVMTGKAVYSDGTVPLRLVKEPPENALPKN